MDYELKRSGRMLSGFAEQSAVLEWSYTIDTEGVHWFWPAAGVFIGGAGAHVHCGKNVGDYLKRGLPRSEGYGGSTLSFKTVDGVIAVQGPWHTNTDSLFERTGVDLRDQHLTWGVIAESREYVGMCPTLHNALHIDPAGGALGRFGRVEALATVMADSLDRELAYYSESRGGSACGIVYTVCKKCCVRHGSSYSCMR